MSRSDKELAQRVRESWRCEQADDVPRFDRAWQRAEERFARSRRRYAGFAAVAAALAVVAVVFGVRPPTEEPTYVEMAELLNSTYWAAPSDVLMPEHRFDIYQDLPELFEST